jgi:uncharacterized protein YjaZ
MNYKLFTTWNTVDTYIRQAEAAPDQIEACWDEIVVAPLWNDLAKWAPFDVSFMKPKAVRDIDKLKTQNALLKELDLDGLEHSIQSIIRALPQLDDDSFSIALFPAGDDPEFNRRQNGVQGAGVFGNIVVGINPLADRYIDWISYVLAHEYHHSIWGGVWYGQKQAAKGDLLEALLTEGQADYFARSLFPNLQPAWIVSYPRPEFERYLGILREHVHAVDRDEYSQYVFGNAEKGLPWCVGYSIGYEIVAAYAKATGKNTLELVETGCDEIFEAYVKDS